MYTNSFNYPTFDGHNRQISQSFIPQKQNNFNQAQQQNFHNPSNYSYPQDERFIAGGFAAPFLLGGLTGALVAPYFNRPPYQNYYYNNYYPAYYRPYPRYW